MDKIMTRFFKSSIISSVTLMILGILLMLQSEATIITISYIIGTLLIALGTLAIIKFLKNTSSSLKSELDVVYGTVTIILGVIVIYNPEAIASIIPIIIGIGIVISSTIKLQYSLELKSNKNKQWKLSMLISIISTVCGVVLICNPFKGAVIIMQIIGAFIIVYSILDIISTLTIKKNVDAIHQAIEGTIEEVEIIDEENVKKTKKVSKTKSKRKSKNKEKA